MLAGMRHAAQRQSGEDVRRPTNPYLHVTAGEVWQNKSSGSIVRIMESDDPEFIQFTILTGRESGRYGRRKADRFRYHFEEGEES